MTDRNRWLAVTLALGLLFAGLAAAPTAAASMPCAPDDGGSCPSNPAWDLFCSLIDKASKGKLTCVQPA